MGRGGVTIGETILGGLALALIFDLGGVRQFLNSMIGTSGGLSGLGGGGGGGGGGATSGGTGSVTDAEIQRWARGIGLSPEVGRRFATEFKRMPSSIDELVNWANSRNYRNATTGEWLI